MENDMQQMETAVFTAADKEALLRELVFSIASAKARKIEAMKVSFPEGQRGEVQKGLRRLQKEGKLLCFAFADEPVGEAVAYLLNKCPSVREDVDFLAKTANTVFLYF